MNCFQVIKSVLDEAYTAIPGDDGAKDDAIRQAHKELSTAYVGLLQNGCLDYSDPARRFAYLYKYTTAHANIVDRMIRGVDALRSLFDNPKVAISCIGGGPGSDFLGVVKFCLASARDPELRCSILDRDPAWGESWSDVGEKLGASLRISTVFHPFDVTDPKNWQLYQKHLTADLFTLVYFMSEVHAKRAESEAYFKMMMSRVKPGALVLYIDNRNAQFYGWFDTLAKEAGLEIVESNEGTFTLPTEEEKTDLAPYYGRYESPKIRAEIAVRVVRRT